MAGAVLLSDTKVHTWFCPLPNLTGSRTVEKPMPSTLSSAAVAEQRANQVLSLAHLQPVYRDAVVLAKGLLSRYPRSKLPFVCVLLLSAFRALYVALNTVRRGRPVAAHTACPIRCGPDFGCR